jgi:hypothetical protein
VLLDEDTQFVAELIESYWANNLINDKESELLYHKLFTTDEIVGKISMREILHDAKSSEKVLGEFFKPNKNSAYKDNYPLGLHGGRARFLYADDSKIGISILDLAEDNNISGSYRMTITNYQRFDSKGRHSTVLKMRTYPIPLIPVFR